jgi:hypothetical protein
MIGWEIFRLSLLTTNSLLQVFIALTRIDSIRVSPTKSENQHYVFSEKKSRSFSPFIGKVGLSTVGANYHN